ncbi:MAG: halocarboxylic acid dehydrogenase DehI family protein, partial [Acidobacteriota bacterium]|nr:halocarboxylic acid dehydrogenase DehI family protein [Acidobacteriota bacterium]
TGQTPALLELGSPDGMYAMEMVEEQPEDARTRQIFDDITSTLSLSSINSDYRTLALWPGYLEAAWTKVKPISQTSDYESAADRLRENSRKLARSLPLPIYLSPKAVEDTGDDVNEILKTTGNFERILPPLILNIALLILDFEDDAARLLSPFPPQIRHAISAEGQL